MRSKGLILFAATIACVVALWAQGLVICQSCGREAGAGAEVCGHCKAKLPKAAAVAAAAVRVEPDKEAALAALAKAAVESGAERAREMAERSPDVALHEYLNAAALMRLLPEGGLPPDLGAALLAGRGRVMQALARGRDRCRRCGGSGRYKVDLGKVDGGKSGVVTASGVACPECKGAGWLAGYRPAGECKAAVSRGRAGFESGRRVAGDVRVGQAFLPAALEALLNVRQRALVMTGVPVPCAACGLTGRQPCRACRGAGWVTCGQAGCRQGVLQETRQTGARQARRLNDDLERRCPTCNGLGEVKCGVCLGSKSVACEKCGGSGLGARCQRCTGTGLIACAKCRGSGEVKGAPCAECKGEGVALCTTCRGEGALAR